MIICLAFGFVLRNVLFRLHKAFRSYLPFRIVYDLSVTSFLFDFGEFSCEIFVFNLLCASFLLFMVCLVFSGLLQRFFHGFLRSNKLFSSSDYLFGFLFVSYMRVFFFVFQKHSDHVFSSK